MVTAAVVLCNLGYVTSVTLVPLTSPAVFKLRTAKSLEERARSLENLRPYVYVTTPLNSILWIIYRLHERGCTLSLPVTAICALLQLVYLFIFYKFTDNHGRKTLRNYLVIGLILTGILVAITKLVWPKTEDWWSAMGIICNIFNMVIAFYSLTGVIEMKRKKSVAHVSIPVLVVSLLNAVVWMPFAILNHGAVAIGAKISNGAGVILGLLQVIVYFYYRCFPSKDEENAEENAGEENAGEENAGEETAEENAEENAEEELPNMPVDGVDIV